MGKVKSRLNDFLEKTLWWTRSGGLSETASATPKLPEDHSPETLPSKAKSLWDRAYDALSKDQEKLVKQYEGLLLREAQSTGVASEHDSNDSRPRRAQLDAVIEQGLRRMDEKKLKYTIAGRKFDLTEQIDGAAHFALWAKDLVSEGVKASPQASIAWAGICIILPLLTNPTTVAQANSDGFAYVTKRLRHYIALEEMLEPLGRNEKVNKALFGEATAHLVDLYQHILEFQLQSILRFYRDRIATYAKDVVLPKDWKQMRGDIESREATIIGDLAQMNGLVARQELEGLNATSKGLLDISKEKLKMRKEDVLQRQKRAQQRQEDAQKQQEVDRKKCLQLFYLIENADKASYESFKSRVEDRLDGTCRWFLENKIFQRWLVQESGPLLVSADPGCGKSVLAKSLLDNELSEQAATVCYFFFKDQVQNTACQALCAVLHQLFSKNYGLIQHAMGMFDIKGAALVHSAESLWKILGHALRDPRAKRVTVVLDALDECSQSEFASLMQEVGNLFSGDNRPKLKVLMTTRPYEHIMIQFRSCIGDSEPIHIQGQESSDAIRDEVNLVIEHRVKQLARNMKLTDKVTDRLKQRLLAVQHRTYLWVYLVFDYLQTSAFRKTEKGVNEVLDVLPTTVNDAYEKILSKSKEPKSVQKILCIILAASRPLTLQEMNVAVNMSEIMNESLKPPAIEDIDLEDEKDFELRLRNLCGLFVSVYQGNIYFLHQTAREFLLDLSTGSAAMLPGPPWQHSINIRDAHTFLSKICVLYLLIFGSDTNHLLDKDGRRALIRYSARYWFTHFRDAHTADEDAIVPIALRLYTPPLCLNWIKLNWPVRYKYSPPRNLMGLLAASFFGQDYFVGLLLDGANIETADEIYYRTPLSWAAENGHEAVVQRLLRHDANVKTRDKYGHSPLSLAAKNGHEAVVQQLLDHGANVETKDNSLGQTPLLFAVEERHEAIVQHLLNHGANTETKDDYSQTPLSLAARHGNEAAVQKLLNHGANTETKDEYGHSPLSLAAKNGHAAVVQQLLNHDANVETRDKYGHSPLSLAAKNGHQAVVVLLKQNSK